MDEKGVQQTFTPTHVVAAATHTPSVVTSERSATTTILGCGNALGYQIPPFFVFAGARMRTELMEGASVGAQGTVSKSGWSNSSVFMDYIQNHFVRYAKADPEEPILLLYDGHRSHISPFLVDWAKENNIILFVLPPHTSHILQPMDVGCFGAFAKIYSDECQRFQRSNGTVVNRYNVCAISSKAYTKALSPVNLQAAFRKSGVYPFNPSAIDATTFESESVRVQFIREQVAECALVEPESAQLPVDAIASVSPAPAQLETSEQLQPTELQDVQDTHTVPVPEIQPQNAPMSNISQSDTSTTTAITTFFKRKRPIFTPPLIKHRRSVSTVVAGKAITETNVCNQLKEYYSQSQTQNKKKKFQPPVKTPNNSQNMSNIRECHTADQSQAPTTSKTQAPKVTKKVNKNVVTLSDSDLESIPDTDVCCVCGKFSPDAIRNLPYVEFMSWAECDFSSCTHWVHLKYCCPVRSLRRHDQFFCPCHGLSWRGCEE
ncbi:MAG: hypothetical protein ABW185_17890 [Sedimenticola sp.]